MKKGNAGKIILGIMFGIIVVLSAILAMLTIRNKKAQNAVAAIQEVQTADSEENAREEKKTEGKRPHRYFLLHRKILPG